MTLDLLTSQLTDPFRIGLLIAMVFTARSTAAQAGRLIPMLFGMIFVAVLIPTAFGSGTGDRTTAIAVGLLSNVIITAVIWAIWEMIARMRRS